MHSTDEPTGLTLKVERVAARVKAKHLADAMGVSASRVSSLEREQFPSPESVRAYRAALATFRNVPDGKAA